jgi:hypothetical protein
VYRRIAYTLRDPPQMTFRIEPAVSAIRPIILAIVAHRGLPLMLAVRLLLRHHDQALAKGECTVFDAAVPAFDFGWQSAQRGFPEALGASARTLRSSTQK